MPKFSTAFRIDDIRPTGNLAWLVAVEKTRRAYWRQVVTLVKAAKEKELAAGRDRYGRLMVPISWFTRQNRRSAMGEANYNAPPLTPADNLSRTNAYFDGRAHADHAEFFWRKGWGRILHFHRVGAHNAWAKSGHLPRRDVIGLSPKSRAWVRTRALAWWDAGKKTPPPGAPPGYPFGTPPVTPKQPLVPKVAKPATPKPKPPPAVFPGPTLQPAPPPAQHPFVVGRSGTFAPRPGVAPELPKNVPLPPKPKLVPGPLIFQPFPVPAPPVKPKVFKLKPKPAPKPVAPGPAGWPTDPTALTHVKALGGSTGATLVKDASGKLYVKKQGASAEHLREEGHADAAYQALGIAVPKFRVHDVGGRPTKLAEFHEGVSLATLTRTDPVAAEKAMAEVRKGFVADALLGNWDVIGLDLDNILVGKDGKVYRIDNGGSLRFRAQGAKKSPSQWGGDVGELQTLRDPAVNPSAAKVFGKVSDAEVRTQAKAILGKRAELLAALPADLRGVMGQRLDTLAATVAAKPAAVAKVKAKAAKLPPPADPAKFRHFTSQAEMDAWGKPEFKAWADPLPVATKELVADYTSYKYQRINGKLRTKTFETVHELVNADPDIKALADALSATAMPHDTTVWRGVENLGKLGVADVNRLQPGHVVKEPAFASTSLDRQVAETFAGSGSDAAVFRLLARKGTPGGYVNAVEGYSSHTHEKEFLIPPGRAKYRIISVDTTGPTPVITAEIVP